MIDECSMWIDIAQNIEPVKHNARESFEYCRIRFNPHQKEKTVLTYHSELDNLSLTIKQDRLYIRNSLHKFYTGGENYSDFKRSDLHESLLMLGDVFQTDMFQANIQNMSLSVNIDTTFQPIDFVHSLYDYKDIRMSEMKTDYHRGEIMGKRADFTDYKYKVYVKSLEGNPDRLRIEKSSKKNRHFRTGSMAIRMNYFEDLFRPEFYPQYKTHLMESINHLHLNEFTMPEGLTISEQKNWFIYMFPDCHDKEKFIKEHGRVYREGIKKLKHKMKDEPTAKKYMAEIRPKMAEKIDYLLNN